MHLARPRPVPGPAAAFTEDLMAQPPPPPAPPPSAPPPPPPGEGPESRARSQLTSRVLRVVATVLVAGIALWALFGRNAASPLVQLTPTATPVAPTAATVPTA